MCGICGQFNYRSTEPVDPQVINRMMNTIVHRGPDDEGSYIKGPLGLGFRRLSIIDLSGGHQPMADASKKIWIVFNGEIYNFKEIRKILESKGHQFRTNSDTEIIVQGYLRWGDEILDRLNGMFGLAIWDENKRRLLVARDPMGMKSLYFHNDGQRLLFGSEIRPILAALPQKPAVDTTALNHFLKYRYTPAPNTIHQGIKKLAAGECLIIEGGQCTRKRWYKYEPKTLTEKLSAGDAEEQLLELYRAAIKRHLISDVPLGLLLSGGMDSALLLALMNECGSNWKTFTIGYGNTFKDDELDDAQSTANLYGADHNQIEISQSVFQENLPQIIGALEEPIASSSIVPMYFVCQRARQDVKVALIGQGPDELFGGYTRHLGVNYSTYWRGLPKILRHGIAKTLNALSRSETVQRGVSSLSEPNRLARYQQIFSLLPQPEINALFQPGLINENAGDSVFQHWEDMCPTMKDLDELNGFQLIELRSSLPDELLMYGDKLSMTHHLEGRIPYLDREVVEFAQTLPSRLKVRNSKRKWLHRKVCHNFLPKEITSRKKRGFAVNVVDDWFKSELGSRIDSVIQDDRSLMYQYLAPRQVQGLLGEHKKGKSDNHKILFSLVVFEQWLRESR